jgi:hypothetical protein
MDYHDLLAKKAGRSANDELALVGRIAVVGFGMFCLVKRTKTFSLPFGVVAITIGAGIILTPLFR